MQQRGDLHHERQLDVGSRESVVHEPVGAVQRLVHVSQVPIQFIVDSRLQRLAAIGQAGGVHTQHQRQHGAALGVVQPLQVLLVRGAARLRQQATVAVPAQHVVDNGPGFDHGGVAIAQHRRLPQRVNRLQFRWREIAGGIALVALEFVVEFQFLQ